MEFPFQLRAPHTIVPPRNSPTLVPHSLCHKHKSTRHLSADFTALSSLSFIKSELIFSPGYHADATFTSVSAPEWAYSHVPAEKADEVVGQSSLPHLPKAPSYLAACKSLLSHNSTRSRRSCPYEPLPLSLNSSRQDRNSPPSARLLSDQSPSALQPSLCAQRSSVQYDKNQPISAKLGNSTLETNSRPHSQQSSNSTLDLSSFLLSLFPLPPRNLQRPLDGSDGSRDLDEPQTPQTQHSQNASLDIFELYASPSPKKYSLLQDNANLCELRLQTENCKQLDVSRRFATMSSTPLSSRDRADSHLQNTPGRAIFSDLPSAYKKITSRPFSEHVTVDLPLPPIPLPSRARSHHSETVPRTPSGDNAMIVRPSPSHDPLSSLSQRPQSENLTQHEGKHLDFEVVQSYGREKQLPYDYTTLRLSKSGSLVSLPGLTAPLSPKSNHSQQSYDDDHPSDKVSQASYDSQSVLLQPPCGDSGEDISSHSESHSRADMHANDGLSQSQGLHGAGVQEKLRLFESRAVNADNSFSTLRRHSDNTKPQVGWGSHETISADSTIDNLLDHYIHQSESSPALTWQASPKHGRQTLDERAFVQSNTMKQVSVNRPSLLSRPNPFRDKRIPSIAKESNRNSFKSMHNLASAESLVETLAGAPIVPLPDVPSDATESVSLGQTNALTSPSAIGHGDTQAILKLDHSSSIELTRGVEMSTLTDSHQLNHPLKIDTSSSSISTMEVSENNSNRELMVVSNDPEFAHREIRHGEFDVEVGNEQRLSQLSSVSKLDGAYYFLNQGTDSENDNVKTHIVEKQTELNREISELEPINQAEMQEFEITPVVPRRFPSRTSKDNSGVPEVWRISVANKTDLKGRSGSGSLPSASNMVKNEEVADGQTAGVMDDLDWVTIPDSRPTLRSSLPEEDSFADFSNCNSFNSIGDIDMHPGDSRFLHSYRLQTVPRTNDQFLVPSYDFSGAVGFPNRNALVEPVRSTHNETYRHPSPMTPSHTNPFTSSPPVTLSSPLGKFAATPSEAHLIREHVTVNNGLTEWHKRGLSVVHEDVNEGLHNTADIIQDQQASAPSLMRSNSDVSNSTGWTSCGPDLDLVPESNMVESASFLGSSSNAGLMKKLRKNDPRMASSPLSTSNSFAKFAVLGPKANVTGSPNGTGMHEVGSSLVGSSSSPYQYSSSPLARQPSTPNTPASVLLRSTRSLRSGMMTSSPIGDYEDRQYGIARQDFATQLPGPVDNFRDVMLAASRFDSHSRRSVSSQTSLLDINLVHEMSGTRNNSGVRVSSGHPGEFSTRSRLPETNLVKEELWHSFTVREARESEARRRAALGQNSPRSPLTQNLIHARSVLFRMFGAEDEYGVPRVSSPHLFSSYRSPSYLDRGSRGRKNYLSWVIFALCCLLPPMLVIYSTTYFDPLMCRISQGEFDSFGAKQKKIARYAGIIGTIVICGGIVIVMVVIHKVPNNLP